MTDAAAAASAERAEPSGESSMLVRAYRAFELLFSVHAKLARREAAEDLRRVVSGLALFALALGLVSFALLLGHAALVLAVERRFGWGWAASAGAVAGADAVVALALVLVARARLSAPVLPETRAMVKKAAAVIRG